ncbi:hypothetical protein [Phenylobacterium sp.]|uniref:hypothetical protein n=1 Tax=Phenylobacterium sp. TaxID=1871053 RepID=UPI0035B48C34
MRWASSARSPAAAVLAWPTRSIAGIAATCWRAFSIRAPEQWPSRKTGPAMTAAPTSAGHQVRAKLRAAIHWIMMFS